MVLYIYGIYKFFYYYHAVSFKIKVIVLLFRLTWFKMKPKRKVKTIEIVENPR